MQLSIFCLSFLFVFASAKEFTPCEIAKALLEKGIKKTNMPMLICMAKKNSPNLDPNVVNGPDDLDDLHFGLFGFGDFSFCQNRDKSGLRGYNKCNLNCDEFLDDNLSNDGGCLNDMQFWDRFYALPHFRECEDADEDEMLGDCDY